MAGPGRQYSGAWRKPTAKGGTLSNAERIRRKEQSQRDRRSNNRQRTAPAFSAGGSNARSNRQMNSVREPRTLIESRSRNPVESEFQQHLTHICRGLPAPVPTRVEVFTFRARLKLEAGNFQPSILLHPSNSITAGVIIGSSVIDQWQGNWRSGEGGTVSEEESSFPNWVDSTMQHPLFNTPGFPPGPISIYDAPNGVSRAAEAARPPQRHG